MKCRICKEIKNDNDFVNCKNKKNGKINVCKECKRVKDKESYNRRKDKINIKKKNKISDFRDKYSELRKGKECKKCGENRYYLLDFHHIDESLKEFNIGTEAWRSLDIIKIEKEVDKCIIFCSNCHREYHFLNKEKKVTIEEYLKVPMV